MTSIGTKMGKITTIEFEFDGGKRILLTPDEAREVFNELREIFCGPDPDPAPSPQVTPVYVPWQPWYSWPQQPWTGPWAQPTLGVTITTGSTGVLRGAP